MRPILTSTKRRGEWVRYQTRQYDTRGSDKRTHHLHIIAYQHRACKNKKWQQFCANCSSSSNHDAPCADLFLNYQNNAISIVIGPYSRRCNMHKCKRNTNKAWEHSRAAKLFAIGVPTFHTRSLMMTDPAFANTTLSRSA